jgi:hypothetical protein
MGTARQYFFITDPEFTSVLIWKESIWNPQGGSYVNASDGILELFYNETEGKENEDKAVINGYATFDGVGKIPEETFWLKAKFRVISRGFNVYPVDDDPKGNVGMEVLCQFNDVDYDNDFALRIGVMFSGFVWNGSAFNEVEKGTEWIMRGTQYDPDLHFLTWVHEMTKIGEWQSVVIDYGSIFNRVFDAFAGDGLQSITVKGLQVFAEGIGIDVKTQFDYVKTEIS